MDKAWVQLQHSHWGEHCLVTGPSMVAVAGRQTRKVRGWLEKAPGELCYTLLFLGAGCFGKREFAGNLILPPVVEIFKGDCAGSWHSPFSCCVFVFGWFVCFATHTTDPSHKRPPDQLLLPPAARAQPYWNPFSAFFKSLHTMHHIRRPHQHCLCEKAASPCSGINQLKKKYNNLRSCMASKREQEPYGGERQWQTLGGQRKKLMRKK